MAKCAQRTGAARAAEAMKAVANRARKTRHMRRRRRWLLECSLRGFMVGYWKVAAAALRRVTVRDEIAE